MPFEIGDFYDRDAIHQQLGGGNLQTSLVVHDGRFLFAAPRWGEQNPDAPTSMDVVGPDNCTNAELAGNKSPIHLFWHSQVDDYLYFGQVPAHWEPGPGDTGKLHFDLAHSGISLLEPDVNLEGRPHLLIHLVRERNRRIRNQFITSRVKTRKCDACNDNLKRYANVLGKDYWTIFEAHHNVPVAAQPGVHQIQVGDFRLLCPDCHRAIHRTQDEKGDILTVEEFRTGLLPFDFHADFQ
jgi:hypothetical protein